MKVILYTQGCPKCKVLEMKLKQKNIDFETISDIEVMKGKNISSLPVLEVDDKIYNFTDAVKFMNELK